MSRLGTVLEAFFAGVAGAVRAAVHLSAGLDAVADDAALAVRAGRRERLYRALEAVERMRGAGEGDVHRLVVIVAAGLTAGHGLSPFRRRGAASSGPCVSRVFSRCS